MGYGFNGVINFNHSITDKKEKSDKYTISAINNYVSSHAIITRFPKNSNVAYNIPLLIEYDHFNY